MANMGMTNGYPWDNAANYKPCRKKVYEIHACRPPIGTYVVNKLEQSELYKQLGNSFFTVDAVAQRPEMAAKLNALVHAGLIYQTSAKSDVVLCGTRGELWTTSLATLAKKYELLIGSDAMPITQDTLKRVLLNKKAPQGVIPWFRIRSNPDGARSFACFVPLQYQFQIPTSWGTLLNGNVGSGHGNGDFVIAQEVNGQPNLSNRYIVNGLVFKDTYNNQGWTDVLTAEATGDYTITEDSLPKLWSEGGAANGSVETSLMASVREQIESALRQLPVDGLNCAVAPAPAIGYRCLFQANSGKFAMTVLLDSKDASQSEHVCMNIKIIRNGTPFHELGITGVEKAFNTRMGFKALMRAIKYYADAPTVDQSVAMLNAFAAEVGIQDIRRIDPNVRVDEAGISITLTSPTSGKTVSRQITLSNPAHIVRLYTDIWGSVNKAAPVNNSHLEGETPLLRNIRNRVERALGSLTPSNFRCEFIPKESSRAAYRWEFQTSTGTYVLEMQFSGRDVAAGQHLQMRMRVQRNGAPFLEWSANAAELDFVNTMHFQGIISAIKYYAEAPNASQSASTLSQMTQEVCGSDYRALDPNAEVNDSGITMSFRSVTSGEVKRELFQLSNPAHIRRLYMHIWQFANKAVSA